MDPWRKRFGKLVDHVPGLDERAKIEAAREGLIPGAFQLGPGRTWWLDLDEWDAHVRTLKGRLSSHEESGS